MSNKPLLLFIFARNCGGCIAFKGRMLPDLERELKKDDRLDYEIVEYEDMSMQKVIGKKPHPDLRMYVRFFPMMILVTSDSWKNHNGKLKAFPKHTDPREADHSKPSILNWINDTITKNPAFSPSSNETRLVPTYGQFHHSKVDESEIS